MTMQTLEEAKTRFFSPFMELLYHAHTVHRQNFNPNHIQKSVLATIKTGNCSEDCSYCSLSSHYVQEKKESVYEKESDIYERAKKAKNAGATRFCIGASGRKPHSDDIEYVASLIKKIKALGLETCATLGLLTKTHAKKLKDAGLDYYNHNIDTSPKFYNSVVTTRTFEDRLKTLNAVQSAGLKVCAGGILGLGETNDDRIEMLYTLASLEKVPDSIPINKLIPIPNTPLEKQKEVDVFDFIRTIALARILMPASHIRLSTGRAEMEDSFQAMCFFAGANSIFIGDTLLTAPNVSLDKDEKLFSRLNLIAE